MDGINRWPVALRWSDFDANMHLRHSAYYDFGATARLDFFDSQGLGYTFMREHHIGPVLFREEALFKREIRPGDVISINILVTRLRRDYSRFSFRHELLREDGTLCAVMHVDGAWIDTNLRKLTVPPQEVVAKLQDIPKRRILAGMTEIQKLEGGSWKGDF